MGGMGKKQRWVTLLGVGRFRGPTDKPYRARLSKPAVVGLNLMTNFKKSRLVTAMVALTGGHAQMNRGLNRVRLINGVRV